MRHRIESYGCPPYDNETENRQARKPHPLACWPTLEQRCNRYCRIPSCPRSRLPTIRFIITRGLRNSLELKGRAFAAIRRATRSQMAIPIGILPSNTSARFYSLPFVSRSQMLRGIRGPLRTAHVIMQSASAAASSLVGEGAKWATSKIGRNGSAADDGIP